MNYSNSSAGSLKESLGGIGYLLLYLSEYFPYTFLATFATVFGFIGNLLIMGAIAVTKELQSVSNIFVFNLALSDILISVIVDSFTTIGVLMGERFFNERPGLCKFVAAACLIFCETSLMAIGFLAFNRYIKICHSFSYNKIFTRRLSLVYCGICWSIGVLITLPNFVGWGGLVYDKDTLNCMWDRLASQSYSIFFPMSSIVVPCLIILVFYLRIFYFAVKSKSRVLKDNIREKLKHSLKIAKGLFISYMIFTLCWLPYGIACIFDFKNQWPRTIHMYTMLIAHMNSSFNPILYAVSNPLFQRGYKNLFKKLIALFAFKKKNQVNTLSRNVISKQGIISSTVLENKQIAVRQLSTMDSTENSDI